MQAYTSTARAIRSARDDYDAACKRLLSERQVLSRILHEWVDEFSATSVRQIESEAFEDEPRIGKDPVDRDDVAQKPRLLATEDATIVEGTAFFDIRFEARVPSGGRLDPAGLVCVEVDVEAQGKFSPGYPLLRRGVYYGARMLSMQGGRIVTGSHYERVRKVVSVWVCTHPPKRYAGTVTTFCLEPERLLGEGTYAKEDYDLLEVVMACLNDEEPGTSEGTLGMLEVLLSRGMPSEDKLETLGSKYGIMVTEDVRNEVGKMCDLGAYLVEEARAEGRAEGRADERRQFVEVAARMVRDGVLATQEAAERFGFTEQELIAAL